MNNINLNKELILTFFKYSLVSYLNLLAAINIVNPYKQNHNTIYDLGFEYLPKINHYIAHGILALIYIYFCIKFWIKKRGILIDFFSELTGILILRLITFTITVMPSALPNCTSRKEGESIIWFTTQVESACSDNMFSGHAAHFVLIALYMIVYSENIYETMIMKVLFVPYLLIIIASRMHYSSDVFIATIVTSLYVTLGSNCGCEVACFINRQRTKLGL